MDPASQRLLVDPTRMRTLWSRLPALRDRHISAPEFSSLWVKPGRHFNSCYHLTCRDLSPQPLRVSAFVLAADRVDQILAEAGEHVSGPALGCRHCCTARAQADVLLQLFPFDYRLPTLRACLDAEQVSVALGQPQAFSTCEPKGYRPGMRCQIHFQGADGRSAYGKLAIEAESGRSFALHERIHDDGRRNGHRFYIPRPLAYLPGLKLTVIEGGAGTSVLDVLRSDCMADAAMTAIAAALADLHALDIVPVQRVYGPRDESQLVTGWVELVAQLFPDAAEELHAVAARLQASEPSTHPARAFVHRDFYDKQILLGGEGLCFLDMDTACHGDPEIDVGNFCAHLQLRGLQGGTLPRCRDLETGFRCAYPKPLESARVDWYRRAALLRLTCGYMLRPNWRHLAPRLLAEAGR